MEDQNSLPGPSNDIKSKRFSQKKFSEIGEPKKFPVIPSNIIEEKLRHLVSEEINEDICKILIHQCSFKLAEVIKAASDYKTYCNRLTFTKEDFNKGLVCCGENPITSYNLLSTHKKKRRRTPKKEKKSSNTLVYVEELWLNNSSPFSASIKELSVDIKNYFNVVTEALFLNDEKISRTILNDIQTNRNIFQLVPHFVNFFCDAMNKYENDFLKVSMLLRFLSSLLRNPHLYFGQDSYLNSLSCVLLKFLSADIAHINQGKDCWLLKDNAADILAGIIKMTKDQHLFFEVLYFMESVLSFENSFNVHYGALVTLNSIGLLAIILLLPNYNKNFQEHTKKTVCCTNKNEIDYYMVQSQIIRSYHLLAKYCFKNEIKKQVFSSAHQFNAVSFLPEYLKDVDIFGILSQLSFSEYFGESLLPSFPLVTSCSFFSKKQKTNHKQIGKKNKKLSH